MSRQGEISKTEVSLDQSLQSEGSFIVLGRSASPNNMSLSQMRNGLTSANNPSTSQAACFSSSTFLNDLSPEEIQNKIQAIVNENIELKDALRQNNLAMKQQFDTLVKWQEEVFKVHQNHKQKFQETKELIQKLKVENAELRKKLAEVESVVWTPSDADSIAKLQAENKILKSKVADGDARDKVVRLLEFQLKTENADLKGKIVDLQKKLAVVSEGKNKTGLNAVVTAEREELGGGRELELEKKSLASFEMVSHSRATDEDMMRQLEEARRVLEVEREALEEDRKALERRQLVIQSRMGEIEEEKSRWEADKGRLEARVMELAKQLEGEKETSKELFKALEESKEEGKWEVVGSPMDVCDSRLGLLRNYLAAQEQKYIKADVWLQKMNQIVLSVIPLDPIKGKEMKEEIVGLRKQLYGESEEVEQHRKYLLEAENLLSELKLSFDTLQAQAESVQTVEKENAQADYHAAQARGYRQKLDEVSARLSQAEECLSNSRTECSVLTNKLRKAEQELEAIPILKTQVEVYQADFNTEREERSRMAADKQQLSEEVHRLRARNQQLLEDLESLERRVNQEGRRPTPERGTPGNFIHSSVSNANFSTLPAPGRGISGSSSAANRVVNLPERTARGSSEPRQFTCPKCFRSFLELGPLEVHVNQCLDTP